MRYLVLFFTLYTCSATASTSEPCLDMARDYLKALDQTQPEASIAIKREQFITSCRKDDEFVRTFIQRTAKGEPVFAIHNNRAGNRLEKEPYKI